MIFIITECGLWGVRIKQVSNIKVPLHWCTCIYLAISDIHVATSFSVFTFIGTVTCMVGNTCTSGTINEFNLINMYSSSCFKLRTSVSHVIMQKVCYNIIILFKSMFLYHFVCANYYCVQNYGTCTLYFNHNMNKTSFLRVYTCKILWQVHILVSYFIGPWKMDLHITTIYYCTLATGVWMLWFWCRWHLLQKLLPWTTDRNSGAFFVLYPNLSSFPRHLLK